MDFSSDEDEDDGSSARKQKEETASSAKTAVKSTTKVASAPIKRVQLSDSEDYGIDSDDEKSHKAALQGIRGVEKEESESDDADSARGSHGYRSDQHQETVVTPASIPSRSTTAVAATPRAVESSVGEDYDEEDEEIASFMDESDEGDPPPFTATVPSRAPISDAVKSGVPSSVLEASKPHSAVQYTNLEKSDEHEESIASKSDYVESFEDEEPPSSKPVVAATAKQVVAASESGVYEDEAFDEESGVVPASVQASNQPPISQLGGSSRAFDYSMDFSDDNVVEGKLETPPRAAAAAHSIPVMQTEAVREQASAPPSPANSHESDRQEQSDYLESDEDRSVIARDLEAPSGDEKLALSASHSSESAVIDVYKNSVAPVTIHSDTEVASRTDVVWLEPDTVRDQKSQGSLAPSAVQQESLTETVSRTIPSDQQSKAPVACGPPLHTVAPTTVTTRGRVLIVREYEQPARESVEMKDASTQFTGNHAGIQADLTPDGMHSLHSSSAPEAPTPPSLPEHRTSGAATDHGKSACDPSPAPAVPPSPPPAPMLGSPGYSMDLLRLPTAVTTSIYKQQLLALQEQILTKKRETERLVQERMTFQYSSLRGTERVSEWVGGYVIRSLLRLTPVALVMPCTSSWHRTGQGSWSSGRHSCVSIRR